MVELAKLSKILLIALQEVNLFSFWLNLEMLKLLISLSILFFSQTVTIQSTTEIKDFVIHKIKNLKPISFLIFSL
jgi:hypothetical protein